MKLFITWKANLPNQPQGVMRSVPYGTGGLEFMPGRPTEIQNMEAIKYLLEKYSLYVDLSDEEGNPVSKEAMDEAALAMNTGTIEIDMGDLKPRKAKTLKTNVSPEDLEKLIHGEPEKAE